MALVQHNNINFTDKRNHSRHQCNLKGKIKLRGSDISDCIVKDISIGGARLLCQVSGWMPTEFSLELPNGFPPITARTIWADNENVGIQFVK